MMPADRGQETVTLSFGVALIRDKIPQKLHISLVNAILIPCFCQILRPPASVLRLSFSSGDT